jgi:hypothetical protein
VFDHGTAILRRGEACFTGSGERFLVENPGLEPDTFRMDGYGIVDNRAGLAGADENIDQVDLAGDITERFICAFTQDFIRRKAATMHWHDLVAVLLKICSYLERWPVGAGIQSHDRDPVGVAKDFEGRVIGSHRAIVAH